MKRILFSLAVVMTLAVMGCSKGGEPVDYGVGDAAVSGGTGGEGSGPTGTQGSEPADNPAADAPPSSENN